MRTNRFGLIGGMAALLLGGALFIGCSDDGDSGNDKDQATGGQGQAGDGSGGGDDTGGTDMGGAHTGGSSSGGAASGGETNLGGGGLGGESNGSGGSAPVEPDAISELNHVVLTGINDLKGLTYSKCVPGKVWASGYTEATQGNRKIVLVRLNENGTFDTSFDTDGIVEFDAALPGQTEESYGVVELPSCELLVQANVSDNKGGALIDDANVAEDEQNPTADDGARPHGLDVVLIKFDATGQVVAGFGTGGVKKIDFGWKDEDDASWPLPVYNSTSTATNKFTGQGFPNDTSWGIELDPRSTENDAKIVVFGFGPAPKGALANNAQRVDNDRYVVRLNAADGSIDAGFNGGKVFSLNSVGNFSDGGRRGIVEADGSILSAGYTNFGTGFGNHVMLLRLKSDGTPDKSFDFGSQLTGVAVTNPFIDDGGVAECYAVGKQSTGRYVTTGYGRATGAGIQSSFGWLSSESNDALSFGILPGHLDTSYGIDGNSVFQSETLSGFKGPFEQGHDVVVLHDDRVVHVGNFGSRPSVQGGLAAYNVPAILVTEKDGFLDESVGINGRFTYDGAFTATTSSSQFYKVALNEAGTRLITTTNANAEGVLVAVLKIGDE